MRLLITGAGGFIGSHLTELALARGHSVRALVEYNSINSYAQLEPLAEAWRAGAGREYLAGLFAGEAAEPGELEIVAGDLRDPFFARGLVRGVEAVINLAALISIPYSYEAAASFIDTNIKGCLNLLEATRAELAEGGGGTGEDGAWAGRGCGGAAGGGGSEGGRLSHFIQLSTSEVYGSAQFVPMSEAHPLAAQSPYSASKIGADALALAYFRSFGLPVIIARPFNTYGPRQSARAIIPTIISQILSGARALRLGSLTPRRDLTFVLDSCEGILALLGLRSYGEVYNIGSGEEVSVGELARLIQELLGSRLEIIPDEQRLRPQNSEVDRLLCDASKLRSATGWQPRVNLREGLGRTIEYLRNNLKQYKSESYNK